MLRHGAGRLGSTLLDEQDAYALQQFNGGIHSLGKEKISAQVLVIHLYLAGKKDGGRFRGHIFHFVDESVAVQTRHEQISQYQINAAAVEKFKCGMAAVAGNHAVASSFKHYLTNGKRLFIIVNAEDRFLGSHLSPISFFQSPARARRLMEGKFLLAGADVERLKQMK